MQRISSRIDWLTITGKGSNQDIIGGQLNAVTAEWFAKDRLSYLMQDFQLLEQMKGNGFYPYCFEDKVTHVRLEVSDDLQHQGWKFVMSGGAALNDQQRVHILQRAVDAKYRVTRIDLAVDLVNCNIQPKAVYEQYQNEVHNRRPLSVDFKERVKGDTFYLGSRDSAYYYRLYDKGKEQGLAEDWKRSEIELKDYASDHYAELMAYDPNVAIKEMIRMIDLPGSRVDFLLRSIMDTVDRERPKTPYTSSDLEVWFSTTVASAFRNLCKEDFEKAQRVLEGFNGYLMEGFAHHMQFINELKENKNA